jgi:S-adenosylmethionine/arginine decarboxylase-like enzyme
MEVEYSDIDDTNSELREGVTQDKIGVSAIFELRNITGDNMHDRSRLSDIMEVIFKRNEFPIVQTLVHNKYTVSGGYILTFIGNDIHMTLNTSPENAFALFTIYTTRVEGNWGMFFEIYEFLTDALKCEYDSKFINVFEHHTNI